jgi:CheY-like chemotaxis protein
MAQVLVADDERGICEAFADFLTSEGHEPITVANGPDAVACVRDRKPDAAFLDIQMPGGDGLAALKEIRAIAPELPIIIMTAYARQLNWVHSTTWANPLN